MFTLHIKNFQSIKDLSIPIQGFTAIVGKSNRGKSAILRALRTVLLNEWNSGFVKTGAKETQIQFVIEEKSDYYKSVVPDTEIDTIKVVKPSNEFTISLSTGEELKYPKVGKNVPEKMEGLNLSSVTTEREDVFNLNFQTQLEPLFLITGTEVEITSFINKVFDISRFEKALREMKTDDIRIGKALEDNENRSKLLQAEQEALVKRIDTCKDNIANLDLRYSATVSVSSAVEEITEDIQKAREIREKQNLLLSQQILIIAKKKYLSLLKETKEKTEFVVSCLQELQKIKEISCKVNTLQNFILPGKKLKEHFSEMFSLVSSLQEQNKIQGIQSSLDKQKNRVSALSGYKRQIELLQTGYSLLAEIRKEYSTRKILQDSLYACDKQLSTFRIQLSAVETLKETLLKSVQICPLCQQSICKEC